MKTRRTNPDYLNGVPELVVLDLLEKRPMYGYEIVQAIREMSDGTLDFGEGCIYPLLHKLEERGDLSSRRIAIGGRTRVVYRVTGKGKRQRAVATSQWNKVSDAISRILQGGEHACSRTA